MSKKVDLSNACFVKIGCNRCWVYRKNVFLAGGKFNSCKDINLSYDEKVKKLLKKRGKK